MSHRKSVGIGCLLFPSEKPPAKLPEMTLVRKCDLSQIFYMQTCSKHRKVMYFRAFRKVEKDNSKAVKILRKREIDVVLNKHEP